MMRGYLSVENASGVCQSHCFAMQTANPAGSVYDFILKTTGSHKCNLEDDASYWNDILDSQL